MSAPSFAAMCGAIRLALNLTSTKQLAEHLGVNYDTLRNAIKTDEDPEKVYGGMLVKPVREEYLSVAHVKENEQPEDEQPEDEQPEEEWGPDEEGDNTAGWEDEQPVPPIPTPGRKPPVGKLNNLRLVGPGAWAAEIQGVTYSIVKSGPKEWTASSTSEESPTVITALTFRGIVINLRELAKKLG